MSLDRHNHADWKPQSAREIVLHLPSRFKGMELKEVIQSTVHLHIIGARGGEFTVQLSNQQCTVTEGLIGIPNCSIRAKDSDYEDLEWGRLNIKMAFFLGKIKVSNPAEVLQFVHAFERLNKA